MKIIKYIQPDKYKPIDKKNLGFTLSTYQPVKNIANPLPNRMREFITPT